jgi:CubicO group peptidase (beta-lactamase class C family)
MLRPLALALLLAVAPSLPRAASAASALASTTSASPLPPQPAGVAWPTRGWSNGALPAGADHAALETAAAKLFLPVGRGGVPDTRALLAVSGGRIVFERYANGFGPASRFRSWSMAKSVTQCLVGLLVAEGRLALDAPASVPAWHAQPGDPRAALTLRHLLQMSSGLDNADGGDEPDSFVAKLLFGARAKDSDAIATRVDLAHEPGSHWAYSTATSQILSGIVARTVGGGREGVRGYVERSLTSNLGITSLVLEFDASETPLGGAYVWANAHDWARLGLLYLRDGRWEGRRVLPEGWVDFTRTPAPAANNGSYGAHFWISRDPGPEQWRTLAADIDAFEMNGNAGQFVVIVPDRDLVVVRLGEMHVATWPELNAQLAELIRAFPPRRPATP